MAGRRVKVILDTDTRQVRKGPDGLFRSGAGKNICDHCGARMICSLVDTVTACETFLPALPFMDETGLHKVSNTMRVGKAWTQRLTPGQKVALYNAKTRMIFGYSQVIYTVAGPIVPMLQQHAKANHIMLETPNNEASRKLGAWMRQNYGPRIIHEDATLTAIYLLRISEQTAAADQQGLEAPGSGEGGAADPR